MLDSALSGFGGPQPSPSCEAGGYVIAGFAPEDAPDIPPAFIAVYGNDYLNPLVYDGDRFAALVASGKQISFVARDSEGQFAGHLALAFSAPNPKLVEVSQGIVLPAHRKSGIFARLMARAVDFARDALGAQAVFGTALTNHAVSQRVLATCGFRDVGLEIDYVPQRMLMLEGAGGPAATLVQYLEYGWHNYPACHLPPSYAAWFSRLLDGAAIAGHRAVTTATGLDRHATVSEMTDMPRFDMTRLLVHRAGFDFWSLVGDHETAAEAAGRRSFQVLINLGNAEGAAAVELLRGWGYACSGLLPGYLEGGQHAAIMYRSFEAPYFDGVNLHNKVAQRLLEQIAADWQRAERLGAELRHAFDDDAVEAPAQAALPPFPDSPRQPMETTLQLLGLGGRVPLAEGGMVPVDLGHDDGLRDGVSPAPSAPQLPLPEQDAAD